MTKAGNALVQAGKAFVRAALAVLIVAVGAVGCRSSAEGPDAVWQRGEVTAGSENLLWLVTRSALEGRGFPVGAGIDASAMTVRTGWRTELAPFRAKGVRRRAEVRYESLGSGRWAVEVRVQQQVNMDIVRPTDPTYAEWEWRDDDVQEARVLLQRLRSQLQQELDVSEPDRRRGG